MVSWGDLRKELEITVDRTMSWESKILWIVLKGLWRGKEQVGVLSELVSVDSYWNRTCRWIRVNVYLVVKCFNERKERA